MKNSLIDWMHDDITWCSNTECVNTNCNRNMANKRIKNGVFSCSDFEGTDVCENITKIIFLDVDGVLNDCYSKSRVSPMIVGVDKAHVRQLRQIMDATGAEVVLTSTWKRGWEPNIRSTQQPTQHGKYLANKLFDFKIKPIGKTVDHGEDRGEGILRWLDAHPWVTDYVIIDDDWFPDYMGELVKHFVQTLWVRGLSDNDVSCAIEVLNGRKE